jgi:hypothetical protein
MKTRRSGFTLIEALAGSLIFAIGAVVICGLSHRCVVNNVRGQEYEQAYRLLDECLDQASCDLHTLIEKEKKEGDFPLLQPPYQYSLVAEPADIAKVYWVTAEVFWFVADQKYSVKADTLLYDR